MIFRALAIVLIVSAIASANDTIIPLEDIGEFGYCARGHIISRGFSQIERCLQIHPGKTGITIDGPISIDASVQLYTDGADRYEFSTMRISGDSTDGYSEGTIGVSFYHGMIRATGGSLMLLPGRMIIAPVDPTVYCSEGSFGTVRTNQMLAGVMGHIALLSPIDNSPIHLSRSGLPNVGPVSQFGVIGMTFGESIRVGFDIYAILDEKFMELTGEHLYTAVNLACEEILNQMPLIKFSLPTDRQFGQNTVDIVLLPEDYIRVENGICRSRLERESDRYTPLVLNLDFGFNVVKHLGIFFDYNTERIGFCDPI